MEVYVNSRGFQQHNDYRWLKITESGQEREEPPIDRVMDLIYSEGYSVVLARLPSEQLLLLITGMEARGRRDIFNRQIRISVAWVGEDSEEPILRKLAVRAIDENEQQSLAEAINRVVTHGGEHGFQVFSRDMHKFYSNQAVESLGDAPSEYLTKKIEPLSPERKKALTEELNKYRLPKETGPLVVVTEIQEKQVLESSVVWWGLSNLVSAEVEEKRVKPEGVKLLSYLGKRWLQTMAWKVWKSGPVRLLRRGKF